MNSGVDGSGGTGEGQQAEQRRQEMPLCHRCSTCTCLLSRQGEIELVRSRHWGNLQAKCWAPSVCLNQEYPSHPEKNTRFPAQPQLVNLDVISLLGICRGPLITGTRKAWWIFLSFSFLHCMIFPLYLLCSWKWSVMSLGCVELPPHWHPKMSGKCSPVSDSCRLSANWSKISHHSIKLSSQFRC